MRKAEDMPRRLNLGSGRDIKEGYCNVDITPFEGIDRVMDLNRFPWNLPSDYFEEILMDNV